jgi:hypothetical protein
MYECLIQVEPVVRMFDILRKDGCNFISQDDLKSMLAGILLSHPGLEFLQETPEFQDRYAGLLHFTPPSPLLLPVRVSRRIA